MKSIILYSLLFITSICYCQDLITLRNGDELKCSVKEVGTEEVKYKKNDSGPLYVLKKSEIFMIKYADGTKDIFKEDVAKDEDQTKSPLEYLSSQSAVAANSNEMYSRGEQDAQLNYKGQHSGVGGTIATTIVISGLVGLVPAIICSSNEPSMINLHIPTSDASNNKDYLTGYKHEAYKIKKKAIWTGWGIGIAINIAILSILVVK